MRQFPVEYGKWWRIRALDCLPGFPSILAYGYLVPSTFKIGSDEGSGNRFVFGNRILTGFRRAHAGLLGSR